MSSLKRIICVLTSMLLYLISFTQVDYDNFNPGYYINRKGDKVEGLVRYERGERPRVIYKARVDAGKKIMNSFECSEFGLDPDIRFIRSPHRIIVRIDGWNHTVIYDFIRVFAEGKIRLYKHYTTRPSKTKHDFTPVNIESIIIGKPDAKLVGLTDDEQRNREILETMFPGQREVVKALMNKDWNEVVRFVHEYNNK